MILLELLLTFLKVGAFTFGGGYAMLPLIESEVLKRGWMEIEELIDFIAVSESTPGPFGVNIATYVGSRVAGFLGALISTVGVITPSFLIILIMARSFDKYRQSKTVKGVMYGLKPTVIGLIAAAFVSLSSSVFFASNAVVFNYVFFSSIGVFLASLVLIFRKVNPIIIICIDALLGIVISYLFV